MSKAKKMPDIPFEAFKFHDVYLTNSSTSLHEEFDPKYVLNLEDLFLQTFSTIEHFEVIGVKNPEDGEETRLFRASYNYGARWLASTEEGLDDVSSADSRITQATIEASFICEYELKIEDPEKISKESYSLFSRHIGAMETWPYWREFLTSQVSRLRMEGVKIPSRRRPDEPEFE